MFIPSLSKLYSFILNFFLPSLSYFIIISLNSSELKQFSFIYKLSLPIFIFLSYIFFILTKIRKKSIESHISPISPLSPVSPVSPPGLSKTKNVFVFDPQANLNVNIVQSLNLMPSNGCSLCRIDKLPLRSHHCKKCNQCIRRFDHHWDIIGGCIGEENFFIFIIFLFFDSLSLLLGEYGIIKSFKYCRKFKIFLGIYIGIIGIVFCTIFGMFLFMNYLLITNQSMYELFHEDQCPYVSIFKLERMKILGQRGVPFNNDKIVFRPFDSGIKKNFLIMAKLLFRTSNKIKWEEIFHTNLKRK